VSDNVLQTLQKLVQDVIAPDVRETKVRLEGLSKSTDAHFEAMQKQLDFRFDSVDSRFNAMEKQMSSMEKSILSAIAESRAHSELASMSAIAALRERIAVLESKHN